MLKFILVIISFICNSCFMTKKENFLQGKIAVNFSDSLFVYDNSSISSKKFKIRNDKETSYTGYKWMNQVDDFVGVEYLQNQTSGISQGNLAIFDISGKLKRRVYESEKGEIAGYVFLSRQDKRLLFTTERKADINLNPLEGLSRSKSIAIIDFKSGKVIHKIQNAFTSLNFELCESPWLYDENSFIYSITTGRNIIVDGVGLDTIQKKHPGIYVYDIMTNKEKMLVPNAHFGICSPSDFRIAYIKGQSIWVMNLNDGSNKIIYSAKDKDRIINIHWSPDGKHIYLAYFYHKSSTDIRPEERLIEVSTNKEIHFVKIGHGFNSYTWK
jgi:hypothetical protein